MGGLFFAKNNNLLALTYLATNRYSVPSGSRADLHTRPEGPSLRMIWMDGWDGISKIPFNFLHTLWVYRKGIYLLIYIYMTPGRSLVRKFRLKWSHLEPNFFTDFPNRRWIFLTFSCWIFCHKMSFFWGKLSFFFI